MVLNSYQCIWITNITNSWRGLWCHWKWMFLLLQLFLQSIDKSNKLTLLRFRNFFRLIFDIIFDKHNQVLIINNLSLKLVSLLHNGPLISLQSLYLGSGFHQLLVIFDQLVLLLFDSFILLFLTLETWILHATVVHRSVWSSSRWWWILVNSIWRNTESSCSRFWSELTSSTSCHWRWC